MLIWESRENIQYGIDSKWLFRIREISNEGREPCSEFQTRLQEIDPDQYPVDYSPEEEKDFYKIKIVLEIFVNGWSEISSSEEKLIRYWQIKMWNPPKMWVCSFNSEIKEVEYLEDSNLYFERETQKLKDHAEFLINSGWNPFV